MSRRLESLLADQVRERPDALAAIAGAQSRSFAEIERRSRAIAADLIENGVQQGSRVAVIADPSLELPAAVLGVLMAGACCVPLDPAFPAHRIEQILAATEARCILHDGAPPDLGALDVRCAAFDGELPEPTSTISHPGSDVEPAFVFFTSGSTGPSKGVVLSHRALLSRQLAEHVRIPLTPLDRMLFRTTISFDVLIRELFWPLIAGCPLVVAPGGSTRDPRYLVDTIAVHGVSVAAVSPTLLRLLLRVPEIISCDRLRHVLSGGEALSPELQSAFYAAMPDACLYNIYGPTEAFTASFWRCPPEWSEDVVPIGFETDLDIALLGGDGEPVADGEVGEIWISGVGVADGYLNGTAEDNARFSVANGDRTYRSGDLAYRRADGALVFSGRFDDQVKLHGRRIELAGVERVLASLPGIRAAAALVRSDFGPTPILVAYVVPESPGDSVASLVAAAADQLPPYSIPAAWVGLEELPVGVTGKLDRERLPGPEGVVTGGARRESRESGALGNSVLGAVRRVTANPGVDRDDALAALALDSVRLIDLILEIEELCGARVELAEVLEMDTVGELCDRADAVAQGRVAEE